MDVQGFARTPSLDQGVVVSNGQIFQALRNPPPTDGKPQGFCTGPGDDRQVPATWVDANENGFVGVNEFSGADVKR